MQPASHRWWLAVALAGCLSALPAVASVESEIAFHRGVVAVGAGHLDQARREFESVLAQDPEDREALRYLAQILQAEGDPASALGLLDRLLALDPEDRELAYDRAVILLELGRTAEARTALDGFLEEDPGHAKAQLFAGVAAYRAGDLAAAGPHLRRAADLDPSLREQARYYSGLVEVAQGELSDAEGSFAAVAEQSPISPLGRSAATLTDALRRRGSARPWRLALTAGGEWDSNPTLAGSDDVLPGGQPNPLQRRDPDVRGVFLAQASTRVFASERTQLSAGYDGYWSLQHEEDGLDLQTNAAWVSGATALGPVRLGLRYDYAYTLLSLTKPFRQLHRATPTLAIRQGDWGLTQPYYQVQYSEFQNEDFPPNSTFKRDGTRHLFGLSQSFFLPQPFRYVAVGAVGDVQNSVGSEWRYDGFETSLGAGYDFPYAVSFSWLWRYAHRDYRDASAFTPYAKRVDDTQWLTAEIARPIVDHWIARVAGSFRFQDSNIPVYDQDQKVVGAYLTYEW